jgi:hypothetical protein
MSNFNGATPMSAWKTHYATATFPTSASLQWGHADVGVEDQRLQVMARDLAELQWGHADVAVEDKLIFDAFFGVVFASMGPRRCRRGRRAIIPKRRPTIRASMGPRRCRGQIKVSVHFL